MRPYPIHQPSPGPYINVVYNNQKGWPKRYKIVAFIVVLLVFANIGAYALRMYYYNQIVNFVETLPTYTPIPSATKEPEFCIQVITPARNPQTGEIRDFPTPCDIPEGWIKI